MTSLRWTTAAVLAALTVVCGISLALLVQPAVSPPHETPAIIAWVLPDGAIRINGERFDDPDKLKAKIAELRRDGAEPEIHLRATPDTDFKPMSKAIILFQKAGALKVGFVTEPRNPPAEK